MFCKAKSVTTTKTFLRGNFRPLPSKNVQILDHFFPLLFPNNSESLKILDIRLWEGGAKRPLNRTSKSEQTDTQTDTQTNTHMDIWTSRKYRPRGPMLSISRFVRPCVCLCVCLSVCSLLEVPFNCFFAPTSRSRMANIFRDSESLGKSAGKKWSHI